MKYHDSKTRDDIRAAMQKAIADNDNEAFAGAFDSMVQKISDDIHADVEEMLQNAQSAKDSAALAARGLRQLTGEERDYYQKLAGAMCASDPKQALSNLSAVLPQSVYTSVFDDLRENHPLLSRIDFQISDADVKNIYSKTGYVEAAWGELCDEIVQELSGGFGMSERPLNMLSAFIPVCRNALRLGPEWLDRYVREILYESIANGMEVGIVGGTGKNKPIGMDRHVGDTASVVSGVYPQKDAIEVTALDMQTIGNLVSLLAKDENGKGRFIRNLILLVNPTDYYTKIMPATHIMAPDGSWRSVMPYDIEIIPSVGVAQNTAIFGLAHLYKAFASSFSKDGTIEQSDHALFLKNKRLYAIFAFADGFPVDNNAFLRLDVSGLVPPVFKFQDVTPVVPSDDATLQWLSLGTLELSPAFDDEEDTYTASTTGTSAVIKAIPANAAATVAIKLTNTSHASGVAVPNGTAATWDAGTNTVAVKVTAEDGSTTETYTVTVTKS